MAGKACSALARTSSRESCPGMGHLDEAHVGDADAGHGAAGQPDEGIGGHGDGGDGQLLHVGLVNDQP